MNQFYADLFWGPGPDSQGTWRSAGGGWAGAGRAGLGLLATRGGAGSAQLSVAGRCCACCGRPAHAGRDATKAPRAGGGARQRPKFYALLNCGQVSGGPQPQLPRHSSPHRPPWRGIYPVIYSNNAAFTADAISRCTPRCSISEFTRVRLRRCSAYSCACNLRAPTHEHNRSAMGGRERTAGSGHATG
jgi:hypothetical protein